MMGEVSAAGAVNANNGSVDKSAVTALNHMTMKMLSVDNGGEQLLLTTAYQRGLVVSRNAGQESVRRETVQGREGKERLDLPGEVAFL